MMSKIWDGLKFCLSVIALLLLYPIYFIVTVVLPISSLIAILYFVVHVLLGI